MGVSPSPASWYLKPHTQASVFGSRQQTSGAVTAEGGDAENMYDDPSGVAVALLVRPRQAGGIDDVDGPTLDLLEDGRDVLTDEAEHEEVSPAQERHDKDRRGPAGHHQLLQQKIRCHRVEPVEEAQSAYDDPHQHRDLERHLGE